MNKKTRSYTVDAQGVVNNARRLVSADRGITMLIASFNMEYELARAIYYNEVDVTCEGDQIISIQQKG